MATADLTLDDGSLRRVLVFTGSSACGRGDGDEVCLFLNGVALSSTRVARLIKASFWIPNTSMPVGARLYACEFHAVPSGKIRIHMRSPHGFERYHVITVGDGYKVPWHASWRYRGWEAFWCGG